jgi:hypothetical protein
VNIPVKITTSLLRTDSTLTIHPKAWPLSYTEWGEIKSPTMILTVIAPGNPGPINPGANWVLKTLYKSPPTPPYVPEK